MPTKVGIRALTWNDLREFTAGDHLRDDPTGELKWSKPLPREKAYWKLPTERGVYAWVSGRRRTVLYIGKADGMEGLRQRLMWPIRRVAAAEGWMDMIKRNLADGSVWDPGHLSATIFEDHSSQPRMLAEMGASLCWAETEHAAEWELRLIYLSLYLTGYAPALNGYAWQPNNKPENHPVNWAKSTALTNDPFGLARFR